MDKFENGEVVRVLNTRELDNFGITELSGRTGVVTSNTLLDRKRNPGYFIKLLEGIYKEHEEWFVPATSVTRVNK